MPMSSNRSRNKPSGPAAAHNTPSVEIHELIKAIRALPSDGGHGDSTVWYENEKEHWLGWLDEYHTAGAYNRRTGKLRDARFAYNHIVNPDMLLWLIEAAGVQPKLVQAARHASRSAPSMAQKSAVVRSHVPWPILARALWVPKEKPYEQTPA